MPGSFVVGPAGLPRVVELTRGVNEAEGLEEANVVTGPGDRCGGCGSRVVVFRRILFSRGELPFVQEEVDLGRFEAGQLDFESEIDKLLQLDGQDFPVPAGFQRDLVVREDIGPLLRLAHVGNPDRGDSGQSEKLGCLQAAMAGKNLKVIVG